MMNYLNFFFSQASSPSGNLWWLIFVGLIVGAAMGYFVEKIISTKKIGKAKDVAAEIIDDAENQAKSIKKEALLEAKEEVLKLKTEFETEQKERRSEMSRQENRLSQKEDTLSKKIDALDAQQKALSAQQSDLAKKQAEVEKFSDRMTKELERVAGLTREEAKKSLVEMMEDEAKYEAAFIVKKIEQEAKFNGEKKAREIISSCIQRCAADQVSESTVTAIALPNDDMKGRLIGREGRNIRAIETATGVDLIIDDTPEVVILSGFDPVRRHVAKISIEKLIADGRIHPARIEEIVAKVRKDIEISIKEAGEAASFDTGVFNLHPELITLLGRLKFRTSYGQNVLNHSIEVSYIAGMMASELGCDVALAKRAGLLHDIGKAVDQEVEGTHIEIGAEIAKKYKESADVINAIMAHHGDVEPKTIEAVLVAAADAVSGARPGARRETIENYVKRLEKLEEIGNSFSGVQKTFAIQAGREIRVMVKPEVISDADALILARDIAKKIESEMEYPGQIKVNVIRETRSVEFAK